MEVEDDGLIPINTMRRLFPWVLGFMVGSFIGDLIAITPRMAQLDRLQEQVDKLTNETAQHSTSDAPNKP